MTVVPDVLPILSSGKHDSPAEGACFMEYTALLAGEPFDDAPECVDAFLTTVMQGFNDRLKDADRVVLVPYLGRAIGLHAPRRSVADWEAVNRLVGPARRAVMLAQQERITKEVITLRSRVLRKLARQLRIRTTVNVQKICAHNKIITVRQRLDCADDEMLSGWYLDAYEKWCDVRSLRAGEHPAAVTQLVRRVELIHRAYEEAMDELGWTQPSEPACSLPQVMELVSSAS